MFAGWVRVRTRSDPKVQFTHQRGPGPTKLGPVHPLTGPDPRTYGVGPVRTQVREGQDRPSDSLVPFAPKVVVVAFGRMVVVVVVLL